MFTDLAKAQLEDLYTRFKGPESTLTRPDNFLYRCGSGYFEKNHGLKKVAWSDSLIIDGTREVELQWIKDISDLMEVSIGKDLLLYGTIRAFLYMSL